MIIEMIVFLAFVIAMGAIIVKAYEWQQDVLYGLYISPTFSHQHRRMTQHAAASQVRESDELNRRPTGQGGAGASSSPRHEAHP